MADDLAGVLTFNPATEFQVLEEFEFEELVQRPENLRFFTLAQQTTNYIEKILPKSGRVSKAVLMEAEYEVESMRQLYERLLTVTDEGYELKVAKKVDDLPWVIPYWKRNIALSPYSLLGTWKSLFSDENRGIQYTAILDSLPRYAFPSDTGRELPMKKPITTVYSEAAMSFIPLLGPYPYNKTAYKEDGSYTIETVYRPETQDSASVDGYRIDVPPIVFPNPLQDNPFLNVRKEPVFMETDEDLDFPSLDLILEHAIPTTSNPYLNMAPFLRVWDLRLTEIPWKNWKAKFEPVAIVEAAPPPNELIPPTNPKDDAAPSDELVGFYGNPYMPGMSARFWLSKQLDGGRFVSVALISKVASQKPVNVIPPIIGEGEALLPEGTAEDCLPTTIQSFDEFAGLGIFRPGTHQSIKELEPGWKGKATCVPLAYLEKEKETTTRLPWLPDTQNALLQGHKALLRAFLRPPEVYSGPKYEKTAPVGPQNPSRAQILAVIHDRKRLPEDVAADLRILLAQLMPEPKLDKHVYSDSGDFLLCEHTLEQNDGTYAANPTVFLNKWSAIDGGSRVCMFCGERITKEVLSSQDQFDEQGRPIQTTSLIQRSQVDHSTKLFTVSLKELKASFDLTQPAQDILFLILSLLQVLPEPEKLKPFMEYLNQEGAKLKPLIKNRSDEKKSSDAALLAAILGFDVAILLIQTHPLIPRRSLGFKPIVTRGFPRDTNEINDAPLIDGILGLLKKSFEEFPVTFQGSSVVFLRVLLTNQKSLRQKIITTIQKALIPKFKTFIMEAREQTKPAEKAVVIENTYQPPLVRFENTDAMKPSDVLAKEEYEPYVCKDILPPWYAAATIYPPLVETKITRPLLPATDSVRVVDRDVPVPIVVPPKDIVAKRIKLGIPKGFGSPTFVKCTESSDAIRLQACTGIILDTIGLVSEMNISRFRAEATQVQGDPSLLRDWFKGLLYEVAGSLEKALVVNLERELSRSMAIRAMFTSADAAKAIKDKLRALEAQKYKQDMRAMNDVVREITKKLQDSRLAPYLITKDDREHFMRELAAKQEEKPEEDEGVVADGEDRNVAPEDANEERDTGEQGNAVHNGDDELEYDYGDYGDARARTADGEEAQDGRAFAEDEGFGS